MLAVTALVAAALVVVYLGLSARIIAHRRDVKIGVGDGGDAALRLKIRAHGNFNEYVPLALLLLAFAESGGAHRALVAALGAALVLARLAHAAGLSRSPGYSMGRFAGTAVTLAVLLILAVVNVVMALPRL